MRHHLVLPLILLPAVLPGQAAPPAPPVRAALETIVPADLAHRVGVIAHDSMEGRSTPSPGLERTARYIAAEFARFGLRPGGDSGGWMQRYIIARRRILPAASSITFRIGGREVRAALDRDARFALGSVPPEVTTFPAFLVGAAILPAVIPALPIRGRVVILVTDYRRPVPAALYTTLEALRGGGAAAVVLLSNRDSATFAQRLAGQTQVRVVVESRRERGFPVLEVHERVLGPVLDAAGIIPATLRSGDMTLHRDLPGLTVSLQLRDTLLESASAPNVVGILDGSDPVLRHEHVVFSAHMDHLGVAGDGSPCRAQGADRVCNGADDDASGTAGILELAEAFSRPGARPRRSLIFLTVSGEERGLWGSSFFVDHSPVPMDRIVADLNMDMIGRNWRDTIVAIGKPHSDLGTTLDAVVAAHPELGLAAIDDRWPHEDYFSRSDHYNFARKGVPILFFFNGVHADYHQPSDSPDRIDHEKQARIVRLVFLLGHRVASDPGRPQWNRESYRQIVGAPPPD